MVQTSPVRWEDPVTGNSTVMSTLYRTIEAPRTVNGNPVLLTQRHIVGLGVACLLDGTEINAVRTVIKQVAIANLIPGANSVMNDGEVIPRDNFTGYTAQERRDMIAELALWTPPGAGVIYID
jgi:hypothetical protein